MTDQEARWIGPDPSAILELVDTLERRVQYAAEYLADAIVDGNPATTVQTYLNHYTQVRAELRRVKALETRLYGSDAIGHFAGHLVRS